jgi:hypothetical protein
MSPMEKNLREHQMVMKEMRELDDFKKCISEIVEKYIKMIDTKISSQDLKIQKTYIEELPEVIIKLFEEDKLTIDLKYDEETESLYIGGVLIE